MRMRAIRRFAAPMAVCLLLLSAATACGGAAPAGGAAAAKPAAGGPSPAASTSTGGPLSLQGPQRQQQLEAEARREGEVDLWTTIAGPATAALGKAFEAKYPFVHIVTFRSDVNTLTTKAVQLAQAHSPLPDVVETPLDGILGFQADGLLTHYYTPLAANVPSEYKIGAGSGQVVAVADRIGYTAFGYNSTKLSAAELPKTTQDLAAPRVRGQLTIATSTTGVRWVGGVLHTLGTVKGEAFLKQMASQRVAPEAVSAAAVMGLIAAGHFEGSPAIFDAHEAVYAKKGAPVGWLALQPVVANVDAAAVTAAAPHPAAALLLIDFLLGPSGQRFFTRYGYHPPTQKQSFKTWVPEAGLTEAQYRAHYAQWLKLFRATFGS